MENLGADKIKHTDGSQTLLDHLIGTRNILKRMDALDYIQDAGLFHSVYGTASFNKQLTSNREEIKQLIELMMKQMQKSKTFNRNLKTV